jgi:hypothetical protein
MNIMGSPFFSLTLVGLGAEPISFFIWERGFDSEEDLHLTGNANALLSPCPSMLVARQV